LDRHRDAQQQNAWFGFISGLGYALWAEGVSKDTPKKHCMGQVAYVEAGNQTPFSYHE
jgi:hypothetical protein